MSRKRSYEEMEREVLRKEEVIKKKNQKIATLNKELMDARRRMEYETEDLRRRLRWFEEREKEAMEEKVLEKKRNRVRVNEEQVPKTN